MALSTFPWTFTEGDREPDIVGTFKDENGTAIDITGYTVVFVLERPTGSTVLEKSTSTTGVTITDAANGEFTIDWVASDLVEGYGQCAQVRLIDTSTKPVTSQDFLIDVKPKKGTL